MNRILVVILVFVLILGISVGGCWTTVCVPYWASIEDVAIWADESLPLEYFLDVEYGFSSCDQDPGRYEVRRVGTTTTEVDIENVSCRPGCHVADSYATHNISLGSDFVTGVSYMVKINGGAVAVSFVAGVMIYLAPIHDVEIWADNSSPAQYFADVMSGEPSMCDHFSSYNVTRAGNTTIIVEIFNVRSAAGCPEGYGYVEHTIALGSDFVTGGNYTVVVNNVTETFVA